MPRVLTFEQAIDDARNHCEDALTVLLGNGFSISYNPQVFRYDSLAEEAELSNLSVPKAELFARLDSHNFEIIMEKLRAAADLQELYGGDRALAARYREDAKIVRNGLADVIAARHPGSSSDLLDEEVVKAKTFLQNFNRIYTLSYDLLLYWVVLRAEVGPTVPKRDGFEYPSQMDQNSLIWKIRPTQGAQQIYYLHGALHYFMEKDRALGGKRLVKLRGFRQRIVSTLRRNLEANKYPLIVTEGTSAEKVTRIERSVYLQTAHRRFGKVEGAVFVHGASMGSNDDHVWETLERASSNVTALYVGIHGDQSSPSARNLIDRANLIKQRREDSGGRSLRLRYYNASTANVWR